MRPQHKSNLSAGDKVGHYGCSGQLVKVLWRRAGQEGGPPQVLRDIECPACGRRHDASKPMWRAISEEGEQVPPGVIV